MSKTFIAAVIQDSTELPASTAKRIADDLVAAIIREMKKTGGFTRPGFGSFRVTKTKARIARNPATGEPIKVKAGKTVLFKASPTLKKAV